MSSRKRARVPPNRFVSPNEPPSKIGRGEFSDEENAHLLGALLKHGPTNIQNLLPYIPTRNEYQVKQRISMLQKRAQQSLVTMKRVYKNGSVQVENRNKVALDRWLDDLLALHEKALIERGVQEELPVRMIPTALSLIAKFEEHPQPEECGGVDLKNVYEFLENMMLGLPSKILNNADAKFLIEGLQRLSSFIDNTDTNRETGFIMCGRPQWRSKGQKPRTYGVCNNEEPDKDEILNLLDSDKYNPFQVPKEWLQKTVEFSSSK